MKKIILLLILFLSTFIAYSQSSGGGVYVLEQAYNSDGNKIVYNGAPRKVMVNVVSYFTTTASYSQYNDMVGMWDASSMIFEYAGPDNGWYIFRLHIPFYGENWLYIYRDFSKIRVSMSFYEGNYIQYRKFVEGEDIYRNPTR